MSLMRFAILSVLSLGLAACASSPSYGPAAGPGDSGYSQQVLEPGRYRVTYRGGSTEQARDFALYRAAELTLANNFEWFQVVSSSGGIEEPQSSGPRISVGGGGSVGRSSRGGVGVGIGFPIGGSSGSAVEVLEILMGTGPKPEDPNAYSADALAQSLRPTASSP